MEGNLKADIKTVIYLLAHSLYKVRFSTAAKLWAKKRQDFFVLKGRC
jgi:hypothetical protein